MSEELRRRIIAYRTTMAVVQSMLHKGIITPEEYEKIDTIIAKRRGLDSCTIFS